MKPQFWVAGAGVHAGEQSGSGLGPADEQADPTESKATRP